LGWQGIDGGKSKDGSRLKIFDPGQFLWLGSGRVSHLWFGFGKFPLKTSNFSIYFSSGQKVPGSKAGWSLIYCRSKGSSGRVRGSGPISRKKCGGSG